MTPSFPSDAPIQAEVCGDIIALFQPSQVLLWNSQTQEVWKRDVKELKRLFLLQRETLLVVYQTTESTTVCQFSESLQLEEETTVACQPLNQVVWSDGGLIGISVCERGVVATPLQSSNANPWKCGDKREVYSGRSILQAVVREESLFTVERMDAARLAVTMSSGYTVERRFVEDTRCILDEATDSPVFLRVSDDGTFVLVVCLHHLWLLLQNHKTLSLVGEATLDLKEPMIDVVFDHYLRALVATPSSILLSSSFVTLHSPIQDIAINEGKPVYTLPLQLLRSYQNRPRPLLSMPSLALSMFYGNYKIIAAVLHLLAPSLQKECLRVEEEKKWNDSSVPVLSTLSSLFHWSPNAVDSDLPTDDDTVQRLVHTCCHALKALRFRDVTEQEVKSMCQMFHIFQTINSIRCNNDLDKEAYQYLLAVLVRV